ncbi:MAG: hypothetical protein JOZ05_06250, partial [Acetobacteraceae bacterium]|nr:hypothetical protein [Acetobacteraceae bacterium]
ADTAAQFARLNALLDRPWVMLSAGAGMEPFRRILTYAFRAGASGYLAGRAIWWPATAEFPDWDRFRARVRSEGVPYVERVKAVLKQHGRPWWQAKRFADGFELEGAGPEFYARYAASFSASSPAG